MKRDYDELKIFQDDLHIAAAREKLMVFLRKLIEDTNLLISHIEKDYEKNKKLMAKLNKKAEI